MAEGAGSASAVSPEVDIDPEFEPQSRPRSCTWPLQRPDLQPGSPAPAAGSAGDSGEPGGGIHTMIPEEDDDEELLEEEDMAMRGPGLLQREAAGSAPLAAATAAPSSVVSAELGTPPRKCSSRRNAWGNLSYADLITRAIESSPEKRLALSQIYEWMVRSVPYFKDKGDSNSSAGWKLGLVTTACKRRRGAIDVVYKWPNNITSDNIWSTGGLDEIQLTGESMVDPNGDSLNLCSKGHRIVELARRGRAVCLDARWTCDQLEAPEQLIKRRPQ